MRAAFASLVIAAFTFSAGAARAQVTSTPAEPAKPIGPPEVAKAPPAVDDPAGAKQLFDQAVELASGGNYAAACPKLEQSLALHEGIGTQFHLAGCWQKIGRTASAYALFEKVAGKAHELGQSEREEVAHARMEALLPKLSRVRIDVTNPAPKTEVKRDDVSVPQSDWGKPVAVDRGAHAIVVTAEGKTPWSTQLDVSEPGVIVAVQVPALADAPKAAPVVPVVAPEPKPEPKEPAPTPEPPPNHSGRRTLAIVVGGVGVAALAAGIFKGAEYIDKNNQAKSICPSGVNCTTDEIEAHAQAVDDAQKARTWAYVGIGVGAAAVAGATVLLLTAPHAASTQRATPWRVLPIADGRGTWGGALQGSF